MSSRYPRLQENLSEIRERIRNASLRAGRAETDITLVAVTKYANVAVTRDLVLAGCHDLGESRPQDLWQKATALQELDSRWHLVGHLQRNKVRRTLPHVQLVHSADSLRLLDELQKEAVLQHRVCSALLEVNVSGDATKQGLSAAAIESLLPLLPQFPNVCVRGLMTMASIDRPGEAARPDFRALRTLRDRLRPHCPEGVNLDELSMGMSGDFEVAIEEGATLVRVGSALFSGVIDEH
jgi:pyridoxal phosphate enzyme (YggS family)